MKSLIKVFALLFCVLNLNATINAQDTKDKESWIGINLNAFYLLDETYLEVEDSLSMKWIYDENTQGVKIGLTKKVIKENRWFKAISLLAVDIRIKKEIDEMVYDPSIPSAYLGNEKTILGLYGRWEIGKQFVFEKTPKFQAGISLSLDPFLRYTQVVPVEKTISHVGVIWYNAKIGTELRLIPQFEYHFKERFSINLKIPVGISSLYFEYANTKLQGLTDEQSSYISLNHQFVIKNPQAAIGLNYRFN